LSINVEFDSLSVFISQFYVIYSRKYTRFCEGLQFQDLNAQKRQASRGLLAFKTQYFKG
jgi:hypothetical protein